MESGQINTGIREGMKVVGSDGENLGTVDQIEGDYMIVRKGFFFPSDHYILPERSLHPDSRGIVC